MPALLTRTSSRPKRSAACWTKAAASASRSMCASTKSAWPPLASISAATRLPRSTSRSASPTLAPSATNRRTVASPMPDAPPVTAAIFPVSRATPWSASVEQRELDGVAHRAVPQVARVKVVATIVDRQHPGRMVGIAQGLVEIDDGVEGVGLAQPLIDLLADRLALRIPGAGKEGLVLEWRQRAADDPDPARLAAHGELLQPGDHLRGGDLFFGLAPTVPQIVGAQHDDGMGHAGLRQHVADEVPVVREAADGHDFVGGEIPWRRDVVRLPRIAPGDPEARRQIRRQMHTDGKVRQRRERELDRIADDERAGGDRRAPLTAEGEQAVRARHQLRSRAAQADACRPERQQGNP